MIDGTPLLRLWARRRRAKLLAMDPVAEQERTLQVLLRTARNTTFGQAHNFSRLRTVCDFQSAVPIRDYDDFCRDVWTDTFPDYGNISWPGPVNWLAVTSGTTKDVTKYIPVTKAMIRSNKRAILDLYAWHLAAASGSKVFGGLNFMLGGSTDLKQQAPGIRSGDLSGIAAATIPAWVTSRTYPPKDLALMEDWEQKIDLLAQGSVTKDIRSIGGTPSWLLLLFERLAALRPECERDLTKIWPNLDLLIHGGVRFDSYKARFDDWLRERDVDYREAYAASEGLIAVSDRGYGEGLRLNLDNGLFYEFIPLDELGSANPTRHWLGTVETGVNYAIVLSTCAGLWGWLIGDTVRFIDRAPPRVLVTGRTSYMMSAFGEHLIGEEIDRGMLAAAGAQGLSIVDYSVGAIFPDDQSAVGGHCYVVEFAGGPPEAAALRKFAADLDDDLVKGNEDYAAHRAGGFGMYAPEIKAVPPGFFATWMKQRGKLGGQNKVPRVINDTDQFDSLLAMVPTSDV